ncbi:6-dicarboxylate N-acetyltransferase [Striga asiatica]|uniref:6-dicarboxylate N-acetyltransferase n=1 Tax=Striga asiatica TaxID=4170 RepID=A0A5A7Q310_STRAF|nr:6-dicarboxylate N-acetyltransferase [Striga asiatica]
MSPDQPLLSRREAGIRDTRPPSKAKSNTAELRLKPSISSHALNLDNWRPFLDRPQSSTSTGGIEHSRGNSSSPGLEQQAIGLQQIEPLSPNREPSSREPQSRPFSYPSLPFGFVFRPGIDKEKESRHELSE